MTLAFKSNIMFKPYLVVNVFSRVFQSVCPCHLKMTNVLYFVQFYDTKGSAYCMTDCYALHIPIHVGTPKNTILRLDQMWGSASE